jgi:hypothetical protein
MIEDNMENTLLSIIARSNRKTLLISLCILLFIGLFIWFNKNYYYNAIYGPFPKTKHELISITDFNKEKECYLQVSGDKVFNSGITQIQQQVDKYSKRVESENTVGFYQVLLLDNKCLVLYSNNQDSSTQRVGALTSLSTDLRKKIVKSAEMEDGDWLLPFMLDTTAYSTYAYIGLSLLVPALILSLLSLVNAIRRTIDPNKHPFYKSAETERLWLQEHQGAEYGGLVPVCDNCDYHKRLFHSIYRSTVSYFFRREESTVQGNYCLSCNSRLFLRFTLITLLGTWWGIIGFFVGPFYIFQNLFNYLGTLLKSIRHT